jgi:hypothetical protein
MLGMLPDIQDMPAINQALAIPLQPGRPPGVTARGPGPAAPTADVAAKTTIGTSRPNLTVPATMLPPAMSRPAPEIRRQTKLELPISTQSASARAQSASARAQSARAQSASNQSGGNQSGPGRPGSAQLATTASARTRPADARVVAVSAVAPVAGR